MRSTLVLLVTVLACGAFSWVACSAREPLAPEVVPGYVPPIGDTPTATVIDGDRDELTSGPVDTGTAFERGFRTVRVAAGMNQPVSFAFAAGSRIYITEKAGRVRVVRDGKLRREPFIDLSAEVNTANDRGLMGIAVHPQFPAVPYVYLSYVYDPPQVLENAGAAGPDGEGARSSRVVRLEADPAAGFERALPGSMIVLLGRNGSAEGDAQHRNAYEKPACGVRGSYVEDCLPADEVSHVVGSLAFGPDQALYVANGDGCSFEQAQASCTRAVDVESLAGKILRIDPITGDGLPDNPFARGDLTSNRAKVHQLGLRNPFRFSFDPLTAALYVGDVGWNDWEEINRGGAGANFGWPCYEGGNGDLLEQLAYREQPRCSELRSTSEAITPSLYAYSHVQEGVRAGRAVVVGTVYRGVRYPQPYRGSLFYADIDRRELRFLSFDSRGAIASTQSFAEGVGAITQIGAEPESDDLYMLSIGGPPERPESALERLEFVGYERGPAPDKLYTIRSREQQCLEAGDLDGRTLAVRPCTNAVSQRWSFEDAGDELYAVRSGLSGLWLMTRADTGAPPALLSLEQAEGDAESRLSLVPQDDGYRVVSSESGRCLTANDEALALQTCGRGREQVFEIYSQANSAPNFGLLADQEHGAGAAIQLQVAAHDAEGADLTFWAVGLPQGLSMDPQSGTIMGSLAAPGRYLVRVRVSDGELTTSGAFRWHVRDHQLPLVRILMPEDAAQHVPGEPVHYRGEAMTFAGQPIAPEAYQWTLLGHHNDHVHYLTLPTTSGTEGSFTYQDHGDNTAMELCLQAADSAGRVAKACRLVLPRRVEYTIDSEPSGLELSWDGALHRTPFVVQTVVGGTRNLIAPLNHGALQFVSWSDGGASMHSVRVEPQARRFVATYD